MNNTDDFDMDDFEDSAYKNIQIGEILLHLACLFSPVWAAFLLYGISQLPLPQFVTQTLAFTIICLLFVMTAYAFYLALQREGVLANGFIAVLLIFILFIGFAQNRPNDTILLLFAGATILLSVCGLFGLLGNLSGIVKLLILALVVIFVILPAGFLYWFFLEVLADIFSLNI